MKMKQLLSVLLSIAVLLSVMTACGSTTTDEVDEPSATGSTSSVYVKGFPKNSLE